MTRHAIRLFALATCLLAAPAAMAQDTDIGENVMVELNTVKTGDNACALTFLVINGHAKPIEKAVYETVLFNAEGQVDRLTLFDFGTLPPGRPRVRQFSVPGLTCDNLSRVLINGAHACTAPELDDNACSTGLEVNSRTEIEVIG
uniref:hypothetical protein n=1 Tax=Roseovarius indicus TaxID=540747 RepID=UPI003B52EF6D